VIKYPFDQVSIRSNDPFDQVSIRSSGPFDQVSIRPSVQIPITRGYSDNEYLVKHFDAWFEGSVVSNQSGISLFIEMELCDKTLEDLIKEFEDSHLKTNGTLTPVGYYIASQVFIQILEGINHLHKQNAPLIHQPTFY
jgi:serine/threonine protein kinase